MGICGWARNSAWFDSMVSKPSRGSRQAVSIYPVAGSKPFWLRATGLFGLPQRKVLPVGRTANLQNIRKFPGKLLIHYCKMPKERFGLEPGTRVGSVLSGSLRPRVTEREVSAGPYLPCTKTARGISGSRHKPVFRDGLLVLQRFSSCALSRLRPER